MTEYIRELKVRLGLDNSELKTGLKQSENALKSFAKTFNAIASAYLSYKVFKSAITGFADFNAELGNSLQMLGVSAEKVSALGGALKRYGGDTNSAIASLKSLNGALQEAKFGGGALIETAKRYGITFQNANGTLMKSDELLESLATQMQRYDKQTQQAIGSSLGLDEAVIRAFSDGSGELQKLISAQKRFGVSTQNDIKISQNFNNAIMDLQDAWSGILRIFSRVALPVLTKIFKAITGFVEFLKKHKQLVIAFFAGLVLAMSPLLVMLAKMAAASAVAFAPFLAVGAAIAGFALAVEDIYGYFMGWDSVTGELVKKFPILGGVLETIRGVVLGIFNAFDRVFAFFKDPSLEAFLQLMRDAGNVIVSAIQKPLEAVRDAFASIAEKITGFFSGGAIAKFLGFSGEAPAVSNQSAPVSNQSSYNITNNINQSVSSATPLAFANETGKHLVGLINQQRLQNGGF